MLRAAAVLTPRAAVEPGEVVIVDGRIAEVRPLQRGSVAPGTVLVPGFVDLQVNGAGPVAVAAASNLPAWSRLSCRLAAEGTTTWCPTLVSSPQDVERRVLELAAQASSWPAVAGLHLEGPYLTVPGAHRRDLLRPAVPAGWAAALPTAVRLVTLAPELPGALDAVETLARRGIVAALGHSRCSADEARAAVDLGAQLVTHVGNAMGPFHHRAPGLLGVALADRRLTVGVIGDGEHLHPVTVQLAFAAKGAEQVALVSDRVADAGLGDEPTPRRRGVRAGTRLSLAEIVARCAELDGVGLHAAVTAATATPARLLDLGDRGRLAPGRRADVVGLVRHAQRWWLAAVWQDGVLVGPEPGRPSAPGWPP